MTERRRTSDDRDDRGRGRDRDDDRGSRGRDRDRDDDRGRDRGSRDRDDDRGRGRDRDDDRGGRSSSGFQYRARSAESVQRRANQRGQEFDRFLPEEINIFNPPDGNNTIRILPPTWDGADHYGIDIYIHYRVGPDEQSYLCLEKHDKGACPICEERAQARRDGEDDEYIKSLEPKKRSLFYLIDRDAEREGVQAWAPGWTCDRDITTICVDKRSGDTLPIDDPDNGFDVDFVRTGTGVKTKYSGWAIARRESSLGKSEWLDFAVKHPLPEQLVFYDYDHIKKAFSGGGKHQTRSDRERDDDRGGRDRDRDDDRGRGREDRGGGRDRDDDRRGRDRDDDRGSRGRDDDRRPSSRDPEFTWEQIHEMKGTELDALVEDQKLGLKPDRYDTDELLADAICKELGIEEDTGRGRGREPAAGDDAGDRLSRMRRERSER